MLYTCNFLSTTMAEFDAEINLSQTCEINKCSTWFFKVTELDPLVGSVTNRPGKGHLGWDSKKGVGPESSAKRASDVSHHSHPFFASGPCSCRVGPRRLRRCGMRPGRPGNRFFGSSEVRSPRTDPPLPEVFTRRRGEASLHSSFGKAQEFVQSRGGVELRYRTVSVRLGARVLAGSSHTEPEEVRLEPYRGVYFPGLNHRVMSRRIDVNRTVPRMVWEE